MKQSLQRFLVTLAAIIASSPAIANATVFNVSWDPAAYPTSAGVTVQYNGFNLYRCNGTTAACPVSNAALWSKVQTYAVPSGCVPGTTCTGTTTQTGPAGQTVNASFYMTETVASAVPLPGGGTGTESGASNVVTVSISSADNPLQPPGQLRFSFLAQNLRVVKGSITKTGRVVVAKGERIDADEAVLVVVDHDTIVGKRRDS